MGVYNCLDNFQITNYMVVSRIVMLQQKMYQIRSKCVNYTIQKVTIKNLLRNLSKAMLSVMFKDVKISKFRKIIKNHQLSILKFIHQFLLIHTRQINRIVQKKLIKSHPFSDFIQS